MKSQHIFASLFLAAFMAIPFIVMLIVLYMLHVPRFTLELWTFVCAVAFVVMSGISLYHREKSKYRVKWYISLLNFVSLGTSYIAFVGFFLAIIKGVFLAVDGEVPEMAIVQYGDFLLRYLVPILILCTIAEVFNSRYNYN